MNSIYLQKIAYEPPEKKEHLFPFSLSLLKDLNTIQFKEPVVIFIGENGVGKSTIIETIASLMDLNTEGGSRNNFFSTYEESNPLVDYCRPVRTAKYPKDSFFYRAESYYNLMTDIDELEKSNLNPIFEKDLHRYSRGESLKELVKHRFFGEGFYLMDEPETGLSVQSQLELLVMMNDLVKEKSQFILSTHSPILLLYPKAQIFELRENHIVEVSAEDNQLYQTWEMIATRKDHFIASLLVAEENR